MRALGALLVLSGALGCYLRRRREGLLPVWIGRALLGDLAVLRSQICLRRTPLPQILEEELAQGLGARWLWTPLGRALRGAGDGGLPRCWAGAVRNLPEPLDRLLAPLGPLLPQGGDRLGAAIDETREELAGFLRAETARQAEQGRVTAALCLAGGCLVILVLL